MRYRLRTLLIVAAIWLALLALSLTGFCAWTRYVASVKGLQIVPIPVPSPP